MVYYEILEDGTIGRSTDNSRVAQALSLNLVTDNRIVYGWNGKRYIAGTEPAKPQFLIDQEKIEELKEKLKATDYVVIKIAEGAATTEEYAEVIKNRVAWRKEINELESNV